MWRGWSSAPDGTLWALRDGHVPTIVRLDAASGAALATISVGLALVHEGGLAFSPQGIAFAASEANGGVPQLFRLDTSNGLATIVGSLGAGRDISGLGLGATARARQHVQACWVLDATSAAVLSTAPVVTTLGSVCGMTGARLPGLPRLPPKALRSRGHSMVRLTPTAWYGPSWARCRRSPARA